ncbi:efflux RND transporter periplasmic adaptor subunit [Sphingomonas sp.]|uniref:efflux RND transporter periplasmic adaptor subunit n=1 Tax=Sphingomonas sp. TaxID=28214 RepID=UPI0035B2FB31
MGGLIGAIVFAAGGAGAGFWFARTGMLPPAMEPPAAPAMPPARAVAYYQDPTGKPDFSPAPKKDAEGRDYLPVYEEAAPPAGAADGRKVLYYRNPMGLPDTSPTPRKDPMGMDYLPVYADAAGDDSGTVTISPGRIQMLGVRTEAAAMRVVARTIRAVGIVQFDERGLAVVSPKFEGWIERLDVASTGQAVRKGDRLLDVYSPDLVAAEQEYLIARGAGMPSLREAALARLRNWDIPATEVEQLARTGKVTRTLTLRAPADGVVIEKPAVAGMRFAPGDTLFRIADPSRLWLIADVFEQDLANVRIGAPARVTVDAYPGRTFAGTVTFIYPSVQRETRTARARIELTNPEALLKAEMYAQAEIGAATDSAPEIAVPASAVIDGGTTQTILVALGDGRFQPRRVRLGRHGDGYAAILEGVKPGESVVVGANFLIDAESNLRAALRTLAQGGEGAP